MTIAADADSACGSQIVAECSSRDWSPETCRANACLVAAAPGLLREAQLLRCLASSPRFQAMTVVEALAELDRNGMGHDDGAVVAKATGGRS
jgi:hypothetical protein